jgi:uncharacterized protein (DUF58 family)
MKSSAGLLASVVRNGTPARFAAVAPDHRTLVGPAKGRAL